MNFDYKWSTIYEENVIIKLVDIIRDYEPSFKEYLDQAACLLLLHFIS